MLVEQRIVMIAFQQASCVVRSAPETMATKSTTQGRYYTVGHKNVPLCFGR